MRSIMIVVFALVAGGEANAQWSFYDKRYCLSPGGRSGIPDCSFNTWEQCRASVIAGRYCSENPNWKPEAPAKKERRPARS